MRMKTRKQIKIANKAYMAGSSKVAFAPKLPPALRTHKTPRITDTRRKPPA
jgi:hypothetical protein